MSAEKQALLDEVKEKIDLEEGFIIASYDKLNANVVAGVREALVKAGGDMFIVKKRIFAKAASEKKVEYSLEELEGHVFLAMAKGNFPAVAKEVFKVAKDTKAVKILGGYFEDKKCQASEVEQISKLPSLDEMRAQIIGLLEAPMSQTLATIDALLSSVLHCMENKISKET
ncbi:MAG: 50S ribosomal protein L10 [Chlamydiia bacterium]|nr:50S ribosomal protein L10 [Chlamydiia bacterium]